MRHIILVGMLTAGPSSVAAQPAPAVLVERNIVYGMQSGLALLMDVHRGPQPNGLGVIVIHGTAWHASAAYDAPPMKEHPYQLEVLVKPLVSAGYTAFVINHRAAPHYRYPAALDDAVRAVRFVRHHAARFGISADRIGAVGASSGGHLVSMLGVRPPAEVPDATDPVERVAAGVQAVVAINAPTDLTGSFSNDWAMSAIAAFLGSIRETDEKSAEWKAYRDASPIAHVSREDAPLLLIHGDKDTAIPIEQSERFEAALKQAQVPAALLRVPGANHRLQPKPPEPDFQAAMVQWLNSHLRAK